jgi:hypothetical protein
MKIEIEKVQKIKPFEPFIVKIQFDTVDEAKEFLIIDKPAKIDHLSDDVMGLFFKIQDELKRQGYVQSN